MEMNHLKWYILLACYAAPLQRIFRIQSQPTTHFSLCYLFLPPICISIPFCLIARQRRIKSHPFQRAKHANGTDVQLTYFTPEWACDRNISRPCWTFKRFFCPYAQKTFCCNWKLSFRFGCMQSDWHAEPDFVKLVYWKELERPPSNRRGALFTI